MIFQQLEVIFKVQDGASNAIAFAGSPTPTNQATEEWTVNLGNKTITAS